MAGYIGREINAGHNTIDRFAGDDSTVTFTLTYPPGSTSSIMVVVDNVVQEPDEAYSVSGFDIVFTGAPLTPAAGVTNNIYVVHGGLALSIPTPANGSVGQNQLAENVKNFYLDTFAGTGSQTDYTLTYPVQKSSSLLIREDGVVQKSTIDYDVLADETTLRFTTAPVNGVEIDVTYLGLRGTEDIVAGSLIVYPYTATASQVTFTGADDNALTLAYTVGYETVYLNGVKLLRDTDYTASDGTSIVLTVGADLDDILEVVSMGTWLPVDSYTKAEADALNANQYTKAEADVLIEASDNNISARNTILTPDVMSQGTASVSGMSSKLYTGNGTSQSIATGIDMATGDFGGLVWMKSRSSGALQHCLMDSVRGVASQLISNSTSVESTDATSITSFDATGFSLGSYGETNTNAATFAAWSFQTNKKKVFTLSGSELITNGTFDTDVTSWSTLNAGTITFSSGAAIVARNGGAAPCAEQAITTIVGNTYRVSFDITATTGTSEYGAVFIGTTSAGVDIATKATPTDGVGTFDISFIATTTTTYISLAPQNDINATITYDNISVQQVTSGFTNRQMPYTAHYNPDMNFSIVGYVGDGVAGHEIPHHLGVVPELTITRTRDSVNTWFVTSSLFGIADYLRLETTAALATSSTNVAIPSNSTISLIEPSWLNIDTENHIQYNFASKSGVCKIGKYIGTGAAGYYVSTEVDGGDAFKPSFVMVKNLTTGGTSWHIWDSIRGDFRLLPDSSGAEIASTEVNLVDSGIEIIGTSTFVNAVNDEYIFMAFAESSIDATKALTNYDKPINDNQVALSSPSLLTFANGFNASGEVNNQEEVAGGLLTFGAGQESKKLYIYRDKDTSWGFSEVRPLTGLTRSDADKYGEVSPSDSTLRTTSKHFDYESDSGVISASGEDANYPIWATLSQKFDGTGTIGTIWTYLNSNVYPVTIQYKQTEKRILKSYRLKAIHALTYGARRFTVEGSNDGLNWTTVDSTYAASDYAEAISLWGTLVDLSANTTAYTYHRLNITANHGNASYIQQAEIEFNTVIASDYYLIDDAKIYNDAGTRLDRVYVGEVTTGASGEVISFENYSAGKQQVNELEVHGKSVFHDDALGKMFATAWVEFDMDQNPPLIRDSYNVKDVVDLAIGQGWVIFEEEMDSNVYAISGSHNAISGDVALVVTPYLGDRTTKKFRFLLSQSAGGANASYVSIMVFGGKKIK